MFCITHYAYATQYASTNSCDVYPLVDVALAFFRATATGNRPAGGNEQTSVNDAVLAILREKDWM